VRARADLARETLNILKGDLKEDEKIDALEALRPNRHAWLVSVLGHGPSSETRWMPDVDELAQVYVQSPDFLRWLTEHVASALDAHTEREKKVSAPR